MAVADSRPDARSQRTSWIDRYLKPRVWLGMTLGVWWRLLARNRFDIAWSFWPTVLGLTWWILCTTPVVWLCRATVARRARRVPITQAPVFIIGHWRSGTTLLHELMVLDHRFTSPTTFECLAPHHFLLTADLGSRWLRFLLPSKRPMDNMATGWDKPQEDEFALCNLGLPSPYATIAFPNRPPQNQEYLTFAGVSRPAIEAWKRGLYEFLQQLNYRRPQRLVLKSPTHTGRVRVLLEMFPEARFIHIVRDPFVVCPSTVHLWRKLYLEHSLQEPNCEGLEEQVLETFRAMYDQFEQDRAAIPAGRLCEVRYEELVRQPLDEIRRIYETLDLDGFDEARPAIEAYWSAQDGYQTNRYELDPELRERIESRWRRFLDTYGYA